MALFPVINTRMLRLKPPTSRKKLSLQVIDCNESLGFAVAHARGHVTAAKELRALLGNDNVSQDETDLADYGVDKYSFHGGPR